MTVEAPAFWALLVGGIFAVVALWVQLVFASRPSAFGNMALFSISFGGLGAGVGYLGTYVILFLNWGSSV